MNNLRHSYRCQSHRFGLLGATSAMQGGFAGKAAEAAGQAEGQAAMASGLALAFNHS